MPAFRLTVLAAGVAAAALAAPAAVAAPRVAADIAPVHSIVAAVMGDLGAPHLIVPPGVSEHDYGLRPSEAQALQDAEMVFWVGPALTPWLEEALDALAPDARRVTLMEAEGVRLLDLREGGPFEAHDHDHAHGSAGHDHEAKAAHDHAHDHAHGAEAAHGHAHGAEGAHEHAHGAEAAHEHAHGAEAAHEHAHGAEGAHEHAHGAAGGHGADPHVWLDPRNGAAIAAAAAEALAAADPANAATYAANAAAFAAEMEALGDEIEARVAPLRGRAYFVFHDAYHYFEDRFGVPAAGSITLSDAEAPRAARVAEIRGRFEDEAIVCVFSEPQFEPRLIGTLIEGTAIRTGALDPIGSGLTPGATLYPDLLRGLADGLADCLDPEA